MNAVTRAPVLDLELVDESGVYVAVGDLVEGKYRIEEVLGIGGMGFVVAATHVELEERFALKFLGRAFLGDGKVSDRFAQEARAACRLRSEHIARVHDVGVHEGAPFMVMEYLVGRDLAQVMESRGALPITEAVEYVMQACEALAVAHRRGIVHRDIKPENLFIVEQSGLPSVKLLDFGISKIEAATTRHTGNLTLGTPCYMAPEQIRSSADADARSDQWSLGVVLYELLSGAEAFRAPSIHEVCAAVLEREPLPLESLRADVPAELVAVIRRCLEKEPACRFEDVAALASALLPFAPSRSLVSAERTSSLMRASGAREVHVSSVRVTSDPPVSHAASVHSLPATPPPRRRWPIVVLGASMALGATGVALLLHHARPAPPVVAAPPAPMADAPPVLAPPATHPAAEVSAEPPAPAETHEAPRAAVSIPVVARRVVPVAASISAPSKARAPAASATESAAPSANAPGVELGY